MSNLTYLPTILAGPMVRRATRLGVHIWIATSQELENPRVRLYQKIANTDDLEEIPSNSDIHTDVALGANLYVYLFRVDPFDDNFFPQESLIAYDILQSPQTADYEYRGDEEGLAIYDHHEDICYGDYGLPTFFLPKKSSKKMRSLYGSCRKLHGPGEDMMQAAASSIKNSYENTSYRPASFFLGGDQVYGDDVSDKFYPYLRELSRELIGYGEMIDSGQSGATPVNDIKKTKREKFLKSQAKFTSGHAANHVMGFGEYAVLYLLAWNPALWRVHLAAATYPYIKKGSNLERGYKGSKDARFVLANIVSYMNFDDHEITDDWNLNPSWAKNVMATRTGPNVIANGLAAYWAFQALGNNPDDYPAKFAVKIEEFLIGGYDKRGFIKQMLEFNRWSYIAPTWPPALVLNTRTERGELHPVNFLGVEKREFLRENRSRFFGENEKYRLTHTLLANANIKQGEPLIVLSPGPLIDSRRKEKAQSTDMTATHLDAESWGVNPKSVIDLVNVVISYEPSPLILLAGDVHYGYETSAIFHVNVAKSIYKPPKVMRMVQLCSSAMKNQPEGGIMTLAKALNLGYKATGEHKRIDHRPTAYFWHSDKETTDVKELGETLYNGRDHSDMNKKYQQSLEFTVAYRFEVPDKWKNEHEYAPFLCRNNLGVLRVNGNEVQNYFYYSDRHGHFDKTDKRTWESGDYWPVKELDKSQRSVNLHKHTKKKDPSIRRLY